MKNRTLTDAEIGELYEFCYTQSVVHYDVQAELVDHLASAIETRWLTEPNVGFEEALNDVYSAFGVGGFSKVRMAKEKELRQKYSRLHRKYIGEFFKLPKIVLTFAVGFILFNLLQISDNPIQTSRIVVLGYALFLLLFLYVFYHKRLQLHLTQNIQFLLYKNYQTNKWMSIVVLLVGLNVLSVITNHSDEMSLQVGNLLSASSMTLFFVGAIVMTVYIPRRIKDDFEKEFPQFIKP